MFATKINLQWAPYRAYTNNNVECHAPTQAGVYKLAHPNNEGTLTVFYVGQAESLMIRFKDHLSASEPNSCIRKQLQRADSRFTYAIVPNKRERDGAERALYDYWKPVCNHIVPTGPAIPINPKND